MIMPTRGDRYSDPQNQTTEPKKTQRHTAMARKYLIATGEVSLPLASIHCSIAPQWRKHRALESLDILRRAENISSTAIDSSAERQYNSCRQSRENQGEDANSPGTPWST